MIKLQFVFLSFSKFVVEKTLLFLILFILTFSNSYAQSSLFENQTNDSNIYLSREKVYLHFDKPYYASGDDIWFKVYLVNAITHQQNAISKIVYVDLIDNNNKIIDSREIYIENGSGHGDFRLDNKLISGQYLIRAYTNYLLNFDQAYFFRKPFQISSLLSTDSENDSIFSTTLSNKILKPDIQFLPEGGHLINEFHNRIGVKALGILGKGINIHGIIIDNNGNKVAAFKASNFGLGLFNMVPMKGKSYRGLVNYMGQDFYYDLPMALDSGVVMQVRSFQDQFQIGLQSSLNDGVKNLTLMSLQKGKIVNQARLIEHRKKALIRISKSDLNQGIVQFTLLDQDQNPICERLAIVIHEEQSKGATLEFSQEAFKKRGLIEIDISLDKSIQNSTNTDVSLSVTDLSVIDNVPFDLNIKSYLLLSSELKGEIENPGYYFMDDDPLRKRNLNILMLTQGWRKYLFAQKLNESIEKFNHDQGITFKGRVLKDDNSEESTQAEVSLVIKENDQILYEKTETDLKGHFDFGHFDMKDSATIVIQVEKVKRNEQYKSPRNQYSIVMDTIEEFDKPIVSYSFKKGSEKEIFMGFTVNQDYIERSKSFQSNNYGYKIDKSSRLLDEVILEEQIPKSIAELKKEEFDNKMKISTALYREPSHRVDFSDLGYIPWGNVLDALNRVPGLSRGSLILLNGTPVETTTLKAMSAQNVHFVDVIWRYRAAIYGSRASGGVIAIYTKNGTEKFFNPRTARRKGVVNFIHPGIDPSRKFYEPKYGTKQPEHKKPDFRSTLCWKPNIKFDTEGKAKISFYAADIPTTYRVELQGITTDGIPINAETFIEIE